MKKKAEKKFFSLMNEHNLSAHLNDFKGPIISENINYKGLKFSWYKCLNYNDTVYVNISVPNYSFPLVNDTRLTMSYDWKFLFGPKSKFSELIDKGENDSWMINKLLFSNEQDKYYVNENSSYLKIEKNKLLYYLKNGYFDILKKYEDSTVVLFYKPIGDIIYSNNKKSFTLGASVTIDSMNQILIKPIDVPDSLWNYYQSSKTFVPILERIRKQY